MKEEFVCKQNVPQGMQVQSVFVLKDHPRKGDKPPDSCECMKPYASQPDSLDWSTATQKTRRQANSCKSLNGKASLYPPALPPISLLWALAILLQSCAVMCMEPDCTIGDAD